jgi:hypothetical protein
MQQKTFQLLLCIVLFKVNFSPINCLHILNNYERYKTLVEIISLKNTKYTFLEEKIIVFLTNINCLKV